MKEQSLNDKYDKLKEIIRDTQSILIAFSGGLDSTLLLKTALNVLPPNKVLAVTAFSPIFLPESTKKASSLAQELRAKHLLVQTNEMHNPEFIKNGPDRCYFCKCELFFQLKTIAETKNLEVVADGTNLTDLVEKRKSIRALEESDIRMPLVKASLTKQDVSKIAEAISLPGREEPRSYCLASRFSHSIEITEDRLMALYNSERWLRERGFSQAIIRHHLEDIARIKLGNDEKSQFLHPAIKDAMTSKLKEFGYKHIVLDLE